MKKLIFVLFVVISIGAFSQELGMKVVSHMNGGHFKKNDTITLVRIDEERVKNEDNYFDTTTFLKKYLLVRNKAGVTEKIYSLDRASKKFDLVDKSKDYIWDYGILFNVLPMINSKGTQNSLRNEAEEDALEYIGKLKDAGLELDDPYLLDYVYTLVAKIAPTRMIDGRPYCVNVLIVKNSDVNACMFPNGTLILNSGMLAALHSEDELVAILSHEISHFVLDHHIQNVNASIERKKRAEFWAGFATVLAAAGDIYMASNNSYYSPGLFTASTALLATSVADIISQRLGCEYSIQQEKEADRYALFVTKALGYDENAYATALNRIVDKMVEERNCAYYFASQTHPALVSRIQAAGMPVDLTQVQYEKMVASAVSASALQSFSSRRYRQSLAYANQNVKNNVATSDDYLINAYCLLYTANTKESNQEALGLVTKAQCIDSNNFNLKKADILIALRQENVDRALSLLSDYGKFLESTTESMKQIGSAQLFDSYYCYYISEKKWCENMILRLKNQ